MRLVLFSPATVSSNEPRSQPDDRVCRWDNYALLALALAVAVSAVVWAFLVDRVQYFDEVGLSNVPYMYVHYGIVTYPAHRQYHSMIVHPPIHYWILGVLMKEGLAPYYAEAVPPLFFALLCIALICCSRFLAPARLAFLLALCVPFLLRPFEPGTRPDVHRILASFAGLLALEDARLRGWNLWRLFLGSALLTYASALHYPGFLGWTGVLVYVVWVLAVKGGHEGRKPMLALIAGGAIVGIPYLVLFALPHLAEIRDAVNEVPNAMGGLSASLRIHLQAYSYYIPQLSNSLATRMLFYPLRAGIPALVLSTPALLVSHQTRGLALAGLPYPLFLLLFMTHKLDWPMYFLLEYMLYVAAVGFAAAWAVQQLAYRVNPRFARWVIPFFALVATTSLLASSDLTHAEFSLRHRFYESEIARAADRKILGPSALVGSRNAIMWYAGGGTHYFDVGTAVLDTPQVISDLTDYFGKFDAIVEPTAFSNRTENSSRKSLISWYADGTLKLKGFYLSARTVALPHLLLSARPIEHVQGYGLLPEGRVARFYQSREGDHVFVAAACERGVLDKVDLHPILRAVYLLPAASASATPNREVQVLITGTDDYHRAETEIASKCVIRDEILIKMQAVDTGDLLSTLRDDQVIHFYEYIEDALDARYGPEAAATVSADEWPDSVTFWRGPNQGHSYHLSSPGTYELFRSDMDSPADWLVYRYGNWYARSGGFKIVRDGLRRADRSARYSSSAYRDHMASALLSLPSHRGGLVIFSIWAKPADHELPTCSLQDQTYRNLAHARPLIRRADGWTLLVGWTLQSGPGSVRIVIQQAPGEASLLDKAYVVDLPSEEWK